MKKLIAIVFFLIITFALISCGSGSGSDEAAAQRSDEIINPDATKSSYLILDGDGDMVRTSYEDVTVHDYSVEGSFTTEAWIHPDKQNDMILVSTGGYEIRLINKGVTLDGIKRLDLLVVCLEGRRERDDLSLLSLSAHDVIKISEWNHIALNFDYEKKLLNFAVNGDVVASVDAEKDRGYMGSCGNYFSIGDHFQPTDYDGRKWDFSGKVGHVRVSSVARYAGKYDPQQILEADSKTIALWMFDEKDGETTFADKSGNNHNLLAVGNAHIGN